MGYISHLSGLKQQQFLFVTCMYVHGLFLVLVLWVYVCVCFWFSLFAIFLNDLVEQFFNRAGRAILRMACSRHFWGLTLLPWHCVSGLVRKHKLICSCVCAYTHTQFMEIQIMIPKDHCFTKPSRPKESHLYYIKSSFIKVSQRYVCIYTRKRRNHINY